MTSIFLSVRSEGDLAPTPYDAFGSVGAALINLEVHHIFAGTRGDYRPFSASEADIDTGKPALVCLDEDGEDMEFYLTTKRAA